MIWNRTRASAPSSHRIVGVDLNSSRVSAATASNAQARTLALSDTHDLALQVNLETRGVGQAPVRRSPHLVCSNYLSQLGLPREWRGPRLTLTPEAALTLTFDALRHALRPIGTQFALTLPEYLSPTQVKSVCDLANKAKLTLTGSASAALAIAAHRADALLAPQSLSAEEKPEWVVPMTPPVAGPGIALIVDVDESALFATAVQVSSSESKVVQSQSWPRASLKLWKDRLLDALSDRCVRLCRRDPRDSADAEQGLYDYLDDALDRSRRGQNVTLAARADRWYQDLVVSPADLENFTASLTKLASESIREMLMALPLPPRAVWLSTRAAELPGLASALYEQSPEGCEVAVLPRDAAAEAAVALDARIRSGTLATGHHDTVMIAIPKPAKITPAARNLIS